MYQTHLFQPKQKPKKKSNPPVIYLMKLDFPENNPIKMPLPKTMDLLLKNATQILKLKRPAKHVFDEEGMPFSSIEDIAPKATVYVSSADIKTVEEDELVLFKPRAKPRPPYKPVPIMKTKPYKPPSDDLKEHLTIAKVHNTVKENMRDALLCLYTSLTDEQKANLNCGDSLGLLLDEYQYYMLQHEMLNNFISPTKSISATDLGQYESDWVVEKIREIKVEFCKFAITGPPQSGKTTLLSIAASVFFQKLQITKQSQSYLIIPINWKLEQEIVDNLPKIYQFYVKVTLVALKTLRPDLIPLIPELQTWFESLVVMKSFGNFSENIMKYPKFPHEEVKAYGEKIHNSYLAKNSLDEFLTLFTTMPTVIAQAFGLKGAVYIMDHFDCCAYQVSKDDETCDFAHYVSLAIKDSPFFVASLFDQDFLDTFEVEKYKPMKTTGILSDSEEKIPEKIIVSNPSFEINFDMCHGCPGYCYMFLRLVDFIENANTKIAIKRPNLTPFKSVVDISRATIARQELLRFCLMIESSQDEEVFDPVKMNDLMFKEFEAIVQ